MLQNINMNIDKLQSEERNKDMKSYLCQIAAKYRQTTAGRMVKKRPDFQKN